MSILTQYLVADDEEKKRIRAMFPEIAKMTHTYQLAANAPEIAKMSNSYKMLQNFPEMLKRSHLGQLVANAPEIAKKSHIGQIVANADMIPGIFGAMGKEALNYVGNTANNIFNPMVPAITGAKNFLGIGGTPETYDQTEFMTNLISDKLNQSGSMTGGVDYTDYGSRTADEPSGDWTGGIWGPEFAYGTTLGKADYKVDPYTGKVDWTGGTDYNFPDGWLGGGFIEDTVNKGGLSNMTGGQPQQYTPNLTIPVSHPALSKFRGDAAVANAGGGMTGGPLSAPVTVPKVTPASTSPVGRTTLPIPGKAMADTLANDFKMRQMMGSGPHYDTTPKTIPALEPYVAPTVVPEPVKVKKVKTVPKVTPTSTSPAGRTTQTKVKVNKVSSPTSSGGRSSRGGRSAPKPTSIWGPGSWMI